MWTKKIFSVCDGYHTVYKQQNHLMLKNNNASYKRTVDS